jgi:hypothetical protein
MLAGIDARATVAGETDVNGLLRKMAGVYRFAAVTLVSAFALLFLLNFLLGLEEPPHSQAPAGTPELPGGPYFRDDGGPIRTGLVHDYHLNWWDKKGAPEVDPREAAEMLADFHRLFASGFIYQPWVGFAEPPFQGPRLNVDITPPGYPVRRTLTDAESTVQGPEEPRIRIFAMGGSTTFGYAVADQHTWPTALSRVLNARAREQRLGVKVEVLNFGRGYYQPSQGAMLALDLLKSGEQPDLFIFLDGVNAGSWEDTPHFTHETAQAFLDSQFPEPVTIEDVGRWAGDLPLSRFAREQLAKLQEPPLIPPPVFEEDDPTARAGLVALYVQRFEQSRQIVEAVCAAYGCETLFLLQPNSRVDYNLELYRPQLPQRFLVTLPLSRALYAAMRTESEYIDFSGLFAKFGNDRKAIIDDVHYTPAFNGFLAEQIADRIDLHALAAQAAMRPPGPLPATGNPHAVIARKN